MVARHRIFRVKAGAIRKEEVTTGQAVVISETTRYFNVDVDFANHREKGQQLRRRFGLGNRYRNVLLVFDVFVLGVIGKAFLKRRVNFVVGLKLTKYRRLFLRHA